MDHESREWGDAVDFVALSQGWSKEKAAKWLCQKAGTSPGRWRGEPRKMDYTAFLGFLPHFSRQLNSDVAGLGPVPLTGSDLRLLCQRYKLCPQAVEEASDRGLVHSGVFMDGNSMFKGWAAGDMNLGTAGSFEVRGFEVESWKSTQKPFLLTPGSDASWPVGIKTLPGKKLALVVEGAADLLAAFHHAFAMCWPMEKVAILALIGEEARLCPLALEHFQGVRVCLLPPAHPVSEERASDVRDDMRALGIEASVASIGKLGLKSEGGRPLLNLCDAIWGHRGKLFRRLRHLSEPLKGGVS